MRTIAAFSFKKSIGQPFVYPKNNLSYCANFLNMMFSVPAEPYEIDEEIVKILNLLLILHADHEQNCSTSTVRQVGSSQANLFASISAGICALWGPLHGGANEEVLTMLEQIRERRQRPQKFVDLAKKKDSGFRLMGFGHRVYKNYDPRAKIIKVAADKVMAKMKHPDPLLDIAKALEAAALKRSVLRRAEALSQRRLLQRPHLPRAGDPDEHVHRHVRHRPHAGLDRPLARDERGPVDQDSRPRQVYTGPPLTHYVPMDSR